MKTFKQYLKENASEILLTGTQSLPDFEHEELKGLVVHVDGEVLLHNERLKKLPVMFGTVNGSFNIQRNNLKDLKDAPKKIDGNFLCFGNDLTDLIGSPEIVTRTFDCSDNVIKSFKGITKHIGKIFVCRDNELSSFEDCPETVGGDFRCDNNKFTSLICINNHIKEINGGRLDVTGNFIRKGGLGLLKIIGLKNVIADNCGEFGTAAEILNKYLLEKDGIPATTKQMLLCKAELEREGLSHYAVV